MNVKVHDSNMQELDIVLNVRVKTDHLDKSEVVQILLNAIHHETHYTRTRRDEFRNECQQFENEHNLSSDKFLERFESGELGDDSYLFSWYAVKHSLDTWERRYQILLGTSIRE